MKKKITFLVIATTVLTANLQAQNNNFYTLKSTSWYDSTQTGWSKVSQVGPPCNCTGPGANVTNHDPVYIYNAVTSYGSLSTISNI